MSNGISLSNSFLTACATAFIAALDAGSGPAKLAFYTLPYPSTRGGSVTSQTKLFECQCSDPAGTASNGVFTAGAISDDTSADATGEVAWVRVTDSDGNWVGDYKVTPSLVEDPGNPGNYIAGSGPFTMDSVSVYAGGIAKVTSWVHRFAPGNAAPLS